MKFVPYNNTLLLRRITSKSDELQNLEGIVLKQDVVDLYEVMNVSPELSSKASLIKIGDIVTACSTGTLLKDEVGNEFILMDFDHITSKVVH